VSDPILAITVQATLIWVIVFSASAPIRRLTKKWAIAVILLSTIAAALEIIFFNNLGIFVTVAFAGYGWGSLFSIYVAKCNTKRERRILDGG